MFRLAVLVAFLALVLQQGQAQLFSRGAPASVMSPEPDGRVHGVPASALSPEPDGRVHGVPASALSLTGLPFVNPPTPRFVFNPSFAGHRPSGRFGNGHHRGHRGRNKVPVFVPVPLFYPIYPDAAYPVADPNVDTPVATDADAATPEQTPANTNADNGSAGMTSEDALRAAYLQGARDALSQEHDARYGGHYMDSRESTPPAGVAEDIPARKQHTEAKSNSEAAPARDSDWPATVFIFKDGHQIETSNFAIMGHTLYDFSSDGLKKVQLANLDKAATIKANDDRGIEVKLP